MLGAALIPIYMLLPPSAAIQGIASVAVAAIYIMYAAQGFFSGKVAVVAVKTGISFLIAYAVFMVLMVACVVAYIVLVMAPGSAGEPWDLVTATRYEAIPVIEKLLDEGADVNQTLQSTALHKAAASGNLEIVELLIARGADVNLQDVHGRIPIFVALAEHQPEVARRLAREETDLSLCATDGSTVLMVAVRAEDLELVRWALDHGVAFDAIRPEKINATALIRAARIGNEEIVALLLERGADPGLTNHEGHTALDLAKGDEVRSLLRTARDRPPEDDSSGAGE